MRKVLNHGLLALALTLVGAACKSDSGESNPPEGESAGAGAASGATADGGQPAEQGGASGGAAGGTTAEVDLMKSDPGRFIAPEISHSKGAAGGIVLLWPRIIPASAVAEAKPLAAQIQQRLGAVAQRALPGRPIDVRPDPERVCPRGGCDGMPVNVVFSRNGNACVVVAVIGSPGETPQRLVPWAGVITLRSDTVPFRDPPESQITVKDFIPCDQLLKVMTDNESFVEAAIRAMAPQ